MAISDISVRPMRVFWNSTLLGSTTGGISVGLDVASTDIVTDQTGTTPQDSIQTGVTITLSTTIMELNAANWNAMIGDATGSNHTPTAGTEVSGWGTDGNLFASMLDRCQALELKPVGDDTDTKNLLFHKTIPVVESVEYASDAASTMSVTFRVFPDSSKDAAIDLGLYGDTTQDFS